MPLPQISEGQVNAAMRHVYTSAGTAFAIFALLGVLPQESVQPALDAVHQIGDGLQQVFGGFSKLTVIIGPIVAVWMGKIAASSASFKSQLKAVTSTAAQPDAVEEKKAVVAATATLPEVKQIVSPTLADAIPSAKVVTN